MKDIQKVTTQDLTKELADLSNKNREFRFAFVGSRVKNVKEGRAAKKRVAQILTELKNRKD
jgi:ribosomal protein L29